MKNTKQPKPYTKFEAFQVRLPLYYRVVWGVIVLFGMVGNCAGHGEQAGYLFAYTAVLWTLLRIVSEALAALYVLKVARDLEAEKPAPDDKEL